MRIVLATNHFFAWTGSEITLSILANLLREIEHEVLVYSDFYSSMKLIKEMFPSCKYTNSLEEVKIFSPQVAYTQHHSVALKIISACPEIPIAHAMLGVLPHLEKLPQLDLGISHFLPISEEVSLTLPENLIIGSSVSIFRNIVDDELFNVERSVNGLEGICCYSYKVSESKFKSLSSVATERGLKLFDHRREPGSIPYVDVPKIMSLGDIVVASGRGAIEAMLCGRVPMIISDCGDDGLVTPENFELLMRSNFSGRTLSQNFNEESIAIEIDRFRPDYGQELQELARHYFGLRKRKFQIFELFDALAISTPVVSRVKINEINFFSQTLDLQRTYAVTELELRDNSKKNAPPEFEARLYVSEIVEGVPVSFIESRGSAVFYSLSKQRQIVKLPLPNDLKPTASIRFDPSNRPVGLLLHDLALLREDGSELWRWNGCAQLFRNVRGCELLETPEGQLLVCLNDDPHFELALPPEVLSRLQPNDCLMVELTPHPLHDVCADFFDRYARLNYDLHGAANRNQFFDNDNAHIKSQSQALIFTKGLENIANLLKNSLERRDQIIAEQSIRLAVMKDELLRAEAQLDLLKDVMLCRSEAHIL